jgi:hypothetical protein
MKTDRHTKLVLGWICTLTMLFSALAPSVSHALTSARDVSVPWNAVCTSTGLQRAPGLLDAGSGIPADRGAGGLFEHCPFCLLQGGVDVLPPSGTALHPALLHGAAAVHAAPVPPRLQPVWPTGQPRAPPSAS